MSANQLYKEYQKAGGTLDFKSWLTRENAKGTIGADSSINQEVEQNLQTIRKDMNKTVLGFPVKTMVFASLIVVAAIVVVVATRKKD